MSVVMADEQARREAIALKSRILRLAAQRSRCWDTGDISTAKDITTELTSDWHAWRITDCRARGDEREAHRSTAYRGSTDTRSLTEGTRTVTTTESGMDRFLVAECIEDPTATTPVRVVHDVYQAWAVRELEDSITSMRLTQEPRRRGIETTRTNTTRMYRGLTLANYPTEEQR